MPSSNNAKEPILPFGFDTTVESIKQKFPDPSVLPQLASQESWGVKQELGEESSRILAERDTSPASPKTFRSWLASTFGNNNPSPSELVESVSRSDESAMRTSESRNRRSSEAQRGGVTLLPELPAGMDPGKPDYDFGKEHQVWHDYSTGRVWKVTRNATFGKSENIHNYLTRLEAQNIVWKDDVRIEGVLPDGRMVTSQPFIEGRHPEDAKELGRLLEAVGWEQNRNRGTVWQAANGRIIMEDVHRHNFIVDGEGKLHAIDTNLVTQDEFLQYEDDEWGEPEDKMADLLDQGVLEQLFNTPAEAEVEAEAPTTEAEAPKTEAEVTPEPEATRDPSTPSRFQEFKSNSAALAALIRNSKDGFTVGPDGSFATIGYLVAPSKATEAFVDENFTDADLEAYLDRHSDMFDIPGSQLGGWFDPDTKRFVLDVSFPIIDFETAVEI